MNKTEDCKRLDENVDILSDVDIMKQLEEGKKSTKIKDFEELAKELGI